MSAPFFVVVKSNGEVWVTSDPTAAASVGGTVHKVTEGIRLQKICTANGTSSVTSTGKNGLQNDIAN